MPTQVLKINIISQEKQLASFEVESITAPTAEGEITVLPGHIPLFARLVTGELKYKMGQKEDSFVVSKGFFDVGPDGVVNVLVDSYTEAREISVERAEAAIKAAQETMKLSTDRRELLLAEAELKRAMLEIQVAQRTKKARI